MTTVDTERLLPGHVPGLCVGCVHRMAELLIHPTPCRRIHWIESKHYRPTITTDADGQRCSDYQATEAEGHSLVSNRVTDGTDATCPERT